MSADNEQNRKAMLRWLDETSRSVVERLLDGEDAEDIAEDLAAAGFPQEDALGIVAMITSCMEAAWQIDGEGRDEDEVLDELVEYGAERTIVVVVVGGAREVLAARAAEAFISPEDFDLEFFCQAHEISTEQAAFCESLARIVCDSHDAGLERDDIRDHLIGIGALGDDSDTIFDTVFVAREAAARMRAGENGMTVFEDMGFDDRPPYAVIMAVSLARGEPVFFNEGDDEEAGDASEPD